MMQHVESAIVAGRPSASPSATLARAAQVVHEVLAACPAGRGPRRPSRPHAPAPRTHPPTPRAPHEETTPDDARPLPLTRSPRRKSGSTRSGAR